MLCAAIDIGSNTTRVLVAEPQEGQLRKVMEQRAYTQIGADTKRDGTISSAKIVEVGAVVATQVRLAQELGAEAIRTVATAAIREAKNRKQAVKEIERIAGVDVDVLSEDEEGRLAFVGATKTLGHPVKGDIGVVDVGGGSCEIIIGTVADGVSWVKSFKIGSGALTDDFLQQDPPSASEIRKLRDHIDDFFDDVDVPKPEQAVAVGGSATSLRTLVGAVLEYETLERGVRVLAGDPDRRRLQAVRARPAAGPHPPVRGAPAREAFRAARPAAADRQGGTARGDHPRSPERVRQRRPRRASRGLARAWFRRYAPRGMAKAREIIGIHQDMPYAVAAARIVSVRADEVVELAGGVLDVGDIERVHDMRVATRRLRAALEVFRPCFPRDELKATLREVKAIADALGERRDRDVTIATLEDFGEVLAAPDRPGIESLVAKLRSEQEEANQGLAGFVDQARLEGLRVRLDELVAAAEELGREADAPSSNGGDPFGGAR